MKMKKPIKVFVFLVGLVVILAGMGLVVAALSAGRAAKMAVETAGTKTLNVGVTVGKAKASIFTGATHLQDIVVKNPSLHYKAHGAILKTCCGCGSRGRVVAMNCPRGAC